MTRIGEKFKNIDFGLKNVPLTLFSELGFSLKIQNSHFNHS